MSEKRNRLIAVGAIGAAALLAGRALGGGGGGSAGITEPTPDSEELDRNAHELSSETGLNYPQARQTLDPNTNNTESTVIPVQEGNVKSGPSTFRETVEIDQRDAEASEGGGGSRETTFDRGTTGGDEGGLPEETRTGGSSRTNTLVRGNEGGDTSGPDTHTVDEESYRIESSEDYTGSTGGVARLRDEEGDNDDGKKGSKPKKSSKKKDDKDDYTGMTGGVSKLEKDEEGDQDGGSAGGSSREDELVR